MFRLAADPSRIQTGCLLNVILCRFTAATDIVIIIIIVIIFSFMQGIYTYILETNYVSRE